MEKRSVLITSNLTNLGSFCLVETVTSLLSSSPIFNLGEETAGKEMFMEEGEVRWGARWGSEDGRTMPEAGQS